MRSPAVDEPSYEDAPTTRLLRRILTATGAPPVDDDDEFFDEADLSAEGLRRSGALAGSPPPAWDAAAERLHVPHANLRGCSLRSAVLSTLSCDQADFAEADLASARLTGALLGSGNFDGALMEDADLGGAHLRFARFREAELEGARFQGTDLRGACFTGAQMYRADLRDAELEEADFRNTQASEADFRGARIVLTDFRGAVLRGADFRNAVLRSAKLDGADLRNANLQNVDLTSCSIQGVWVADAVFDRTKFHLEQLGGRIGEEIEMKYELARRGYLTLERNFLEIGDPDAASWAYGRRRRAQKLQARQQAAAALRTGEGRRAFRNLTQYVTDKTVELICGYGESVPRVLLTYFAVFVAFAAYYGVTGSIVDGGGPVRQVTRAPLDVLLFTMVSMLAPGNHPEDLYHRSEMVMMVALLQSFISIFLIGLLGFVAGNRIRR